MLARTVIGILAAATSLSPGYACSAWETWLTDEEIAIAKAGGVVPWRSLDGRYVQPTLPDIPFSSPIVLEGAVEPDAIRDARTEMMLVADRPFDVAHSTPSLRTDRAAPAKEQTVEAPAEAATDLKYVLIACSGSILVNPNP
jgi:hypothetical protein